MVFGFVKILIAKQNNANCSFNTLVNIFANFSENTTYSAHDSLVLSFDDLFKSLVTAMITKREVWKVRAKLKSPLFFETVFHYTSQDNVFY